MTNITKHDSEQEGEDGNGKEGRINLLVSWNTVSVNNLLEGSSEVISFEVSWWFFESGRLPHCDNVGESELKHSSFVLGNPYFGNHGAAWLIVIFNNFQHVQSVVDEQLSLNKDSISLILRTLVLSNWYYLLQILFQFLLSHRAQLFGVVDCVLNFFYLLEDSLFVGLQGVPFGWEWLADPDNFVEDGCSWLEDNDEGSPWLDGQVWVVVLDLVLGDAEGVEDGVSLGGSEDGPAELQHIFVGDDSGDVDKSELFESSFGEIDFLSLIIAMISGAKNFPGLEQKIFEIFEINNFSLCTLESLDGVINRLESSLDILLDLVDHSLLSLFLFFEHYDQQIFYIVLAGGTVFRQMAILRGRVCISWLVWRYDRFCWWHHHISWCHCRMVYGNCWVPHPRILHTSQELSLI